MAEAQASAVFLLSGDLQFFPEHLQKSQHPRREPLILVPHNVRGDIKIRASAQGLFMLMTNGIGAYVGTYISGRVVDHFTVDKVKDWHSIWFSFAAYALVLGITFPLVFRYRHTEMDVAQPAH